MIRPLQTRPAVFELLDAELREAVRLGPVEGAPLLDRVLQARRAAISDQAAPACRNARSEIELTTAEGVVIELVARQLIAPRVAVALAWLATTLGDDESRDARIAVEREALLTDRVEQETILLQFQSVEHSPSADQLNAMRLRVIAEPEIDRLTKRLASLERRRSATAEDRGEILRRLRKLSGLSQAQLAEQAGLSEKTVRRDERSPRRLTKSAAVRYARVLSQATGRPEEELLSEFRFSSVSGLANRIARGGAGE